MAMQQEAIQEEVPTIYKAYFWAYVREYPQNIWPYMVLTYLHFRILKCLGESCFFLHCQTVVSTICRWLAMFSFQVKSLWSWPIFPGTRSQLITEATSSIQKLAGSWLCVFFPGNSDLADILGRSKSKGRWWSSNRPWDFGEPIFCQ